MSAMQLVRTAVIGAALLTLPGIAAAQQERRHSRVDIGVQMTMLAPEDWFGAVGPRVDIRFGERRSLEIAASFRSGESSGFFTGDFSGSYSLLYKRRVGNPDSRTRWFLTAGGMGFVREKTVHALRPARLTPPIVPVFGVGVEHALHRRIGVRADLQFLLIVPTAHIGLFVPFGGR